MSATATVEPPASASFERRLQLFDRAPGFIAILRGPDHVFEWVNQAYLRLVGDRPVIGLPVREAIPEIGSQGFFEIIEAVYRTGERFVAEHTSVRLENAPGEPPVERFLDFIYEPMRDEDGRVEGVFCEGHDVTAQHLAQEALKTTQKRQVALIELTDRFRDLDDLADISFAAAEVLGRTLGVSRAGYGTIDRAQETIFIERDWNAPGLQSLAGVLHFRDYGSYIEDLKRGETVVFADAELDPRTAATAEALKAISAQAVVNMPVTEQGGFVALLYLNHATARPWTPEELAFVREVAERTRTAVERRRAEHELRDLAASLERQVAERTAALTAGEARMRAIFESSYQYQGLMTLDGVLLEANTASLQGIQSRLEDVVGRPFWETPWFRDTPGASEQVRAAIPRVAAGETLRQELRLRLPGGWRWFDFTMRPLRNAGGEVTGLVPEAVEITEQRQAEEALRQSQKLESMGQLTGGVAHDFNNLLTPIIGSLDMLQRRGFGGPREQRLLDAALASAERAKTLVQRLLAFARRQPLQPAAVDVGALVSGMAELVSSTTGPQIKVSVEVETELPAARADPNQLEMAILNLSVNARDAMPDGGVLRLSAAKGVVTEGHRSGLPPGSYVRLSVADTGVGMDEAVMSRAVEPFFSTKGVGKGTGLGLSMVHGLASQLGGALTLASQPGQGTEAELWLPISQEAPRAAAEAPIATPHGRAAGKVLLVDDEAFVRMSTAEMLGELGYEVIEASSAREALDVLRRQAVDLLVTDHLMPGMTGVELAREAKRAWPDTPVIVISGFAENEGLAADLPRLTKPFRQAELASVIASLRT